MRKSTKLIASCSALALALGSSAASAQDDGAPEASDDRSGGIEDIIVTAERKPQIVQKSSLSISVLDEAAIAQIKDARDIGKLVPSVDIANGGVTLQSYIRGVGDYGSSALNQSSVAFNIDGVYVANTAEVSSQFYDLQRVEVLKGPQGTLYGRNASAGAINLNVNTPQLGRLSGDASAEIGNYDSYALTGAVNLPLGEKAALRVAGLWQERDGYLSDGTDDDKTIAGRAQLLFEPSETISIRLAGSIAHRGGKGPGAMPIFPGLKDFTGANNPVTNAQMALNDPNTFTPGAGLPPATFLTRTGNIHDEYLDIDQHEVHAEVVADLGFAELTYVPSYRWAESDIGTYVTAVPFMNQEKIEQQSHELRLAGKAGIVDYVVGAYYLDLQQTTAAQIYTSLFVVVDQIADVKTESIAPFGQVTVHASDDLRLIAGARYTVEDKTIDAFAVNYVPLFGGSDTFDFVSDVTFKNWSWRAGIEFDASPDNMIYLTASKGFKSGGINIFEPTPDVTNAYQPERLFSYVLGSKNRFLDDTVQLNVEGYYWKYKDSQQNRLETTPSGALQFSTFNAASATLYGADLDLLVKLTPNDQLTGALSYLHTKFDSFVYNTPFPTNPANTGCVVDNSGPFSLDCSGLPLPRAPKWSGAVGYQHIFDLNNGGAITVGGSMQFASSRFQGESYTSRDLAKAYQRFDAQISYENSSGTFNVTAFMRNIGDEVILRASATRGGIPFAQVAPPRTFGVRVSTRF